MKKNISAIILMIALAVCGCDSYLDRQPDDQLTSKNIFDKKTTTLQYLVNVYTYIPSEWSPEGYGSTSGIAITASDEASCVYTGSRFFALLNHNQLSPVKPRRLPSCGLQTFVSGNKRGDIFHVQGPGLPSAHG